MFNSAATDKVECNLSSCDIEFLDEAYQEAMSSRKEGGIPIGAVLVLDGEIMARGHNRRVQENSMINFDPNLLKHAVDNLITNALKVAIKNVIVSLSVDRHYVEIHVEDDGPGISALEMKNIFEPFATLNTDQNLYKHIGLGLTIAKSIVELHKGSIVVSESNQLGGAKFTIKIPR